MNIKYTNDLSLLSLLSEGLTRTNILVWTGLWQSIPLKVNIPNFKVILDLESLKCHEYCLLIISFNLDIFTFCCYYLS